MADGRAGVKRRVAASEAPVLVRLPAGLRVAVADAVLRARVADEADDRRATVAALVVAEHAPRLIAHGWGPLQTVK